MTLVTLTSDFGLQDYMPAAVKGQLLQINASFNLVDVSHCLPPFNYPRWAYTVQQVLKHFPPYTFHMVLLNLFEQPEPDILLVYHKQQYVLIPDNGLLTMIFEETPEMVLRLAYEDFAGNTLAIVQQMGATIQALADGMPLHQAGTETIDYLQKLPMKPVVTANSIEGQILFVDNFENVVVNITRPVFEAVIREKNFTIIFSNGKQINRISKSYADVAPGEVLALFNTAGYLELAINKGNAAGLLGLQAHSHQGHQLTHSKNLFYQTVIVQFEV